MFFAFRLKAVPRTLPFPKKGPADRRRISFVDMFMRSKHGIAMMTAPSFWIEANVLTVRECNDLTEALSQDPKMRSRAGARHLMANPFVAALTADDRLLQIAR